MMQKPGTKLELLVATSAIVVCGVAVSFSSVLARHALTEMYNVDLNFFRGETRIALTAQWWAPVAFGALVIGLLTVRLCRPVWHWMTWSVLGVTCLIMAVVLYGVVSPFATTTFRMNNTHAPLNLPTGR